VTRSNSPIAGPHRDLGKLARVTRSNSPPPHLHRDPRRDLGELARVTRRNSPSPDLRCDACCDLGELARVRRAGDDATFHRPASTPTPAATLANCCA
jgi:hypothetical protein